MQLQQHIRDCYEHINPVGINAPVLISQKGTVYTVQRINVMLKEIKKKYRLQIHQRRRLAHARGLWPGLRGRHARCGAGRAPAQKGGGAVLRVLGGQACRGVFRPCQGCPHLGAGAHCGGKIFPERRLHASKLSTILR